MEARLGHDFSKVRIHTDEAASAAADAIGARAFALKDDIVFGAGEYAPDTIEGGRLLTHELVHVAQQRDARTTSLAVGAADGPAEREAHAISHSHSQGPVRITPHPARVQLDPKKKVPASPAPGPIIDRLKKLMASPCITVTDFETRMDNSFFPGVPFCKKSKKPSATTCSYAALVLGESHAGGTEHDLGIEVVGHFLNIFKSNKTAPSFTEESQSGSGNGLFSKEFRSAQAKPPETPTSLFKKFGVTPTQLGDDKQYESNTWAPALVKGSQPAITYTGYHHTAQAVHDAFASLTPGNQIAQGSPGPPIFETITKADRRALVFAMIAADSLFEDVEIDAYRQALSTYPSQVDFEAWLKVFEKEWNALVGPLTKTCVLKLANDVYLAIVAPYGGLQYLDVIRAVWADASAGGKMRAEKHWELFSLFKKQARFKDTKKKKLHLLAGDVDATGKVTTSERDY